MNDRKNENLYPGSMNYMKTIGEVFSSLFVTADFPQSVSNGVITKLNIATEARSVTLGVNFDGLVERNVLFEAENVIAKILKVSSVVIKPILYLKDPLPLYLSLAVKASACCWQLSLTANLLLEKNMGLIFYPLHHL